MIDKFLLILVFIFISLLLVLAQTYSLWKELADILITILSVTGSLIAIREFIKNRRD